MTDLAHQDNLHFELGGPSYRFMQRIGLIKGGGPSIGRRIVAFLLLTWVPLLILSIVQGVALGPTPQQSFLLDFASHARFFIAIPLLFIAEVVVGPKLRMAGLHLARGGLVPPENIPAVEAAMARVARRREALWPELLIFGLSMFGAWRLSLDTWVDVGASWSSLTIAGERSFVGIWYHFVAVPILQFFLLRWVWRLVIWTMYLRDLSRLNLRLIATHPDQAGGIGFLGMVHATLGIFPFALSCIVSAEIAFRIHFEGAQIQSFATLAGVYLAIIEVICLGPTFIFVPSLIRAKRNALLAYGALANTYNLDFQRKWVEGAKPENEQLLGTADIQSLADLGNSYQTIRAMRSVPITKQEVIQLVVVSLLPGLPLAFVVMPVGQLLKLLTGVLL